MEDLEIIELYHRRNEQAIRETSNKYGGLLYSIAHDVLHSREDSEETVNDTYGKAWSAMPPQRPNALCAFLSRITRNLAISQWRKAHTQKRSGILVELSELESDHMDAADELNLKELTATIETFLLKLPKDERVLFVKRYFFAMSISKLATEAGQTESQISGRLYRLRQKLKTKLEQEGYVI